MLIAYPIASKLAENPVDMVVLNPFILNLIDTWLAGELITVFGKAAGFTDLGPSLNPCLSNSLIDQTLPSVDPIDTPVFTDISSCKGVAKLASSNANLAADETSFVALSKVLTPLPPKNSSP